MANRDEMQVVINSFVAGAELRPPRELRHETRIRLGGADEIVATVNGEDYEAHLVGDGRSSMVLATDSAVRFAYVLRTLRRMAAKKVAPVQSEDAGDASTRSRVSASS